MSTNEQIQRLTEARNTLRNKAINLKLANVESSSKIDVVAAAFDGIANNGSITSEVKEGETYTIPAGYHDGSGTVSGVAGGGNYSLQSKSVTPTKSAQAVTSDEGYYGLADVQVAAIPEAYQDVTSVTAGAGDVLANKVIVDATGAVVAGTMPNNGAVSKTLDTATTSYAVPKGYHDGTGTVQVVTEDKSAVPTEAEQVVSATSGKVLKSVTVAPIPSNYITTDDATAEAAQILDGATAYVDGELVEGSMPNNGAVSKVLDATSGNQSFSIAEGYHDGQGAVSIALEEKSATPTKSEQAVTPSAGKVLSKVTVAPIPAAYQDVTSVDAAAADVLAGKTIVAADGAAVEGSMPNNGAVSATIDGLTATSYTVPAGYTTGGTVSLTDDIETALAAI